MNTDRHAVPDSSESFMTSPKTAWLAKVLALLLGAVAVTVGVMFSMLALAVLLVVGVILFGVLLWKTRHLRRQLQQRMNSPGDWPAPAWQEDRGHGTIIDGEAVRQPANEQGPALVDPSSQTRVKPHEANFGTD